MNNQLTARKVTNILKKAGYEKSEWERVSRTNGFEVTEENNAVLVFQRLSPSFQNFNNVARQEHAVKSALRNYRDALQHAGLTITVGKDMTGLYLLCQIADE